MIRRLAAYAATSLALLTACELSMQLPEGELREIAADVSAIGHPLGKFEDARVIGGAAGGCLADRGGKYVDVAIDYSPALSKHTRTMTVRFHVSSLDPCEVETEVLEDTGPSPFLLDNDVVSPVVGEAICEMLADG